MKFIISSAVLLKNLQSISGVLGGNNNQLPILNNFYFELNNEKLKATAADNETRMSVLMDVNLAEGEGNICIPAKMLLEILKTFSDTPVTIDVNHDNFAINLTAGDGLYQITGYDSTEYPTAEEIPSDANSIEIDNYSLNSAISKTLFATGNDEMRITMTGVLLEINENDLTFVATDSHKLVRYKRLGISSNEVTNFVIPQKPLNILKGTLGTEEYLVTLSYTNNNAFFSFNNFSLSCRLIDGKYPNYNAIIPKDNPCILTVNRMDLLNSIKRISLFANQSTRLISLDISATELEISAKDYDLSNSGAEKISCQLEGEPIILGFSSKFIQETLNNLNTENVQISMSTPTRAVLILPIYVEEIADEDILTLVMPVALGK